MSSTENKHDLATSEGGRGYLADLFRTELKRHDFAHYINVELAADFACVLSRYLKPLINDRVRATETLGDLAGSTGQDRTQSKLSELAAANGELSYALSGANKDIARWQAEAEMWKGNHDCMVKRTKLLRERPDLPVDRLPAYKHMEELQQELERYRQYGCTSCDGSGHIHSIIGDYHGACTSCLAYELEQAQRTVGSLMHERDTLRTKLAEAESDLATYREYYVTRTACEAATALAVPK